MGIVLSPPDAQRDILAALARQVMSLVLPTRARIVSDPSMMRAIIGNLVGNAIKYTERGPVLIRCRKRRNSLSIEILDTRSGIPAEQLGAIFDAFTRSIRPARAWASGCRSCAAPPKRSVTRSR